MWSEIAGRMVPVIAYGNLIVIPRRGIQGSAGDGQIVTYYQRGVQLPAAGAGKEQVEIAVPGRQTGIAAAAVVLHGAAVGGNRVHRLSALQAQGGVGADREAARGGQIVAVEVEGVGVRAVADGEVAAHGQRRVEVVGSGVDERQICIVIPDARRKAGIAGSAVVDYQAAVAVQGGDGLGADEPQRSPGAEVKRAAYGKVEPGQVEGFCADRAVGHAAGLIQDAFPHCRSVNGDGVPGVGYVTEIPVGRRTVIGAQRAFPVQGVGGEGPVGVVTEVGAVIRRHRAAGVAVLDADVIYVLGYARVIVV